jgi:hypothetical protein
MFGPCLDVEGFEPCLAPSGRDAYQILIDSLDALVCSGVIAPGARPGAELPAWSMVHGFAALVVEGALKLPPRERATAVGGAVRTLLAGLGADPALLPPMPEFPGVDPRAPAPKASRAAR